MCVQKIKHNQHPNLYLIDNANGLIAILLNCVCVTYARLAYVFLFNEYDLPRLHDHNIRTMYSIKEIKLLNYGNSGFRAL